jgi:hypothetical protein
MTESYLQTQCVKYFRYRYPKLKRLLFAVPNGHYRNKATGVRLKNEGVVPGVADIILLIPNRGFSSLCIELKVGRNKQTENQLEWAEAATSAGNLYKVVTNFDQFRELVDWYMN